MSTIAKIKFALSGELAQDDSMGAIDNIYFFPVTMVETGKYNTQYFLSLAEPFNYYASSSVSNLELRMIKMTIILNKNGFTVCGISANTDNNETSEQSDDLLIESFELVDSFPIPTYA